MNIHNFVSESLRQIKFRFSILNQRLSTPAPQVAQAGWALHGHVFTADLRPASGLTVFLVDGQKAYQQQFGFAVTDDTAYFLLNYAGAAGPAQTAAQLFVEISNQGGKAIYLSPTPFQPVLGGATYREIILPT